MIPKIIHRIHLGPNEPQIVKDAWELSKSINKGWEHVTHNEDSLENFPICRDYLNISDKYSFKSDLMRVEALYNWGGAYIDTDVFCIRSFDDLLKHDTIIVGLEDENVVGSAVILSPPKNEKILEVLNLMINSLKEESINGYKYDHHSNVFTPTIFTKTWRNDDEVVKLPPEAFFPIHWAVDHKVAGRDNESIDQYLSRIQDSITENTYCSHKSTASWW